VRIGAILFVALTINPLFACKARSAATPTETKDAVQLRAEVTDLETQVANLKNETEIDAKALDNRQAYEDAVKQVGIAQSLHDNKALEHANDKIRLYEPLIDHSKTLDQLLAATVEARKKLSATMAALRLKQNDLDRRTNVDQIAQQFKATISLYSAVLVGLVILGFFVVALRDENVRQTVFRGESGIQFLALFSVIIAIILFGITGVLEGKELAGLLGGLSGYILGRVTANTTTSSAPPAPHCTSQDAKPDGGATKTKVTG
jgi:hypothetical protein